MEPVPGYPVSTPYKATGSHWTACGWHTGVDYAAPYGAPVVAARAGSVAYVAYGTAFGGHQFVVRPGDGTEDFYAHCGSRLPQGAWVHEGQQVSVVDAEGDATGPHLHFERHSGYGWSCSLMSDPSMSVGSGGGWLFPAGQLVYAKYLVWRGHELNPDGVSDSIRAWQEMLNRHPIPGGSQLPVTGQWFDMTANETRLCQRHHIPPEDEPYPEAVFVGAGQWDHVSHAVGSPPYVFVT